MTGYVADIPFEFVDEEELAAIEAVFSQIHAATQPAAGVFPEQGMLLASSYTNAALPDSQHIPTFCDPTSDRHSRLLKCPRTAAAHGGNWSFSSRANFLLEGKEEPAVLDGPFSGGKAESSSSASNTAFRNKRRFETLAGSKSIDDIEDGSYYIRRALNDGNLVHAPVEEAVNASVEETLETVLSRRLRRGLAVTDFTALEWCEKQAEFSLTRGKPEQTAAMKAGTVRHTELEVEVISRVEVTIESKEDSYAVRLINFLVGAQQLMTEGLTRELPVMSLVEDIWVVGIIDELRMCGRNDSVRPLIVDTKTRVKPTSPSPPQKRNARMQLMLYKLLWDKMVTSDFPDDSFIEFFGLERNQILSSEVQTFAESSIPGSSVKTLHDLLEVFKIALSAFSKSHDLLVLRYEWQEDRSLIAEDEFNYEQEWLQQRVVRQLQYYRGLREAELVPGDELWKCRFCSFSKICPINNT